MLRLLNLVDIWERQSSWSVITAILPIKVQKKRKLVFPTLYVLSFSQPWVAPSSAKIGKRYGNSVIQFAAAMPTRQEEPTAAAAAKNSRDTHGILIKRVLLFSRAGIRVCLSDDASYGEWADDTWCIPASAADAILFLDIIVRFRLSYFSLFFFPFEKNGKSEKWFVLEKSTHSLFVVHLNVVC